MRRCKLAAYPKNAEFTTEVELNPDLYGPFWIQATLYLLLIFCGDISARI